MHFSYVNRAFNFLFNQKINTKLKKYDKIIQRHIKQGVEETSHYAFSVVNTGMHSNIRKILSKIMYG